MQLIEQLEDRRLFSVDAGISVAADPSDVTPPQLLSVHITGTPRQATALQLQFSEPLDPARATDLDAYRVTGKVTVDVFDIDRRRLHLVSATYDDATRTVTLTPERVPFGPDRYLRRVIVQSSVTDVNGNHLDGNANGRAGDDAVVRFRPLLRGRSFTYLDEDQSRVRLRLQGPGRMTMLQELEDARLAFDDFFDFKIIRWGDGVQLWIEGATPDTILTGFVTRGRGGDTETTIDEINNPGIAQMQILDSPSFEIGIVKPSI